MANNRTLVITSTEQQRERKAKKRFKLDTNYDDYMPLHIQMESSLPGNLTTPVKDPNQPRTRDSPMQTDGLTGGTQVMTHS